MADFDAQLPVRAIATEFTTEVADSAGVTINPAKEDGNLLAIKNQTDKLTFTATRLLVDASGTIQPVSGTVTAYQGTPNSLANGWPVKVTDGTNILGTGANPIRIDPTGTTTQPVSGTVTSNIGTTGGLLLDATFTGRINTLGQKTMANSTPVVIASDQSAIPVTFTPSVTPELPQYNTATSLAASASSTQTYSPGSTVSLDGVDASASGQMKIEIQWGTTGAETTKAVFFTSKGNLQLIWRLPNPVSITNTMSVKVIRTNMDNQAMDVYSTIQVH
jgi:hypothetical protein